MGCCEAARDFYSRRRGQESHNPDDAVLLNLMQLWAPESRDRQRILRDNPVKLYDF